MYAFQHSVAYLDDDGVEVREDRVERGGSTDYIVDEMTFEQKRDAVFVDGRTMEEWANVGIDHDELKRVEGSFAGGRQFTTENMPRYMVYYFYMTLKDFSETLSKEGLRPIFSHDFKGWERIYRSLILKLDIPSRRNANPRAMAAAMCVIGDAKERDDDRVKVYSTKDFGDMCIPISRFRKVVGNYTLKYVKEGKEDMDDDGEVGYLESKFIYDNRHSLEPKHVMRYARWILKVLSE